MSVAVFPCTAVTSDNHVFFGGLCSLYTVMTHWGHSGHNCCSVKHCNSLTEEKIKYNRIEMYEMVGT